MASKSATPCQPEIAGEKPVGVERGPAKRIRVSCSPLLLLHGSGATSPLLRQHCARTRSRSRTKLWASPFRAAPGAGLRLPTPCQGGDQRGVAARRTSPKRGAVHDKVSGRTTCPSAPTVSVRKRKKHPASSPAHDTRGTNQQPCLFFFCSVPLLVQRAVATNEL